MKKLLLMLLCLATLLMASCGDKYAKEKEAMTKAEKAAMAVELPVIVKPYYFNVPRPTQADYKKYWDDLKNLVEAENKILAETRKSDEQIAGLEKKAESDSDRKNLQEFKDKLRKERIDFVRKLSKKRVDGDPVVVGIGNTWPEIEMVYGKPKNNSENTYSYDGIVFSYVYTKGVPPKGYKVVSYGPNLIEVTSDKHISDAGIKIGMKRAEVQKILKEKYVNKMDKDKSSFKIDVMRSDKYNFDDVIGFSMKDTGPGPAIVCNYKNDALVSYGQFPNR